MRVLSMFSSAFYKYIGKRINLIECLLDTGKYLVYLEEGGVFLVNSADLTDFIIA